MTTYFSETFETCNLAGWTVSQGGSGTVTCSSTQKHGGSYSMRIYSPALTDYAYAYKSMTEALGDHHLNFWIYVDSSVAPDICYVIALNDVSLASYSMIFRLTYVAPDYLLQQHDGTAWGTIAVLTPNQWHEVDAYFLDAINKVKYWVDDVYVGTWAAYNGAADPDRVFPCGDTSSVNQRGYFYLDDIVVDDVAAPPTFTQTISETLGMSDSVARRADFKQTIAETLGAVDSTARQLAIRQTISEVLGMRDSVEARKHVGRLGDLPDHYREGGA